MILNEIKSKLQKYYFSKKLKNAVVVIDVVLAFLYLIVMLVVNNADSIGSLVANGILYELLLLAKEFLVVAFSITTTAILSTWFIDVKEKNRIYGDVICNDFLASKEFYNTLSNENRNTILTNLEKNVHFKGSETIEEMYTSISRKLENLKENYYYSECSYDIQCNIADSIVTKEITRTINLRSFSEMEKVENLYLTGCTYRQKDGTISFNLTSLTINDKDMDVENDVEYKNVAVTKASLKGCGYTNKEECYLKKPIDLSNSEDTTIILKYITRVRETDNSYACRIKYPCKSFTFRFALDTQTANKYTLSYHAFGFIDDADKRSNTTSRDCVNVSFNDWIFNSDGVDVIFSKK